MLEKIFDTNLLSIIHVHTNACYNFNAKATFPTKNHVGDTFFVKLGGKGDVSPKTKILRITETSFCLILEQNKALQIFGDFWFLFQNRIFLSNDL